MTFRQRYRGQKRQERFDGDVPYHEHSADDILGGVFRGIVLGGDFYSTNWLSGGGTVPANLAAADAGATTGFYWDVSEGSGQLMGDLFVGGEITVTDDFSGNDVVMLSGENTTYRLWVGHTASASAPFRVSKTGALTATGATVSGTITATAGAIGGFDIGADYIRDAANSFGLASTVTGGDDVRFWAGDTFANRATADFRVTESGAVTATTLDLVGNLTLGTGGVFRNSASGERIEIVKSATDQILWYTGHADELFTGYLSMSAVGSAGVDLRGTLRMEPPTVGDSDTGFVPPHIIITGYNDTYSDGEIFMEVQGTSSADSTLVWQTKDWWLVQYDDTTVFQIDSTTRASGAWTSFTPTWTGSGGNPSIGNGTLTGSYFKIGRKVSFRIKVVAGSTTTFGSNTYSWALPVTAASFTGNLAALANGFCIDSGTATYAASAYLASTTTLQIRTSAAYGTTAAHNSPMTWANGDSLTLWGEYEAAA